jgi:hypothetical protein
MYTTLQGPTSTSLTPHKGGLFLVPVQCGDKCLGAHPKFIISKHAHDFLFFLPLRGVLNRMIGFHEYSV